MARDEEIQDALDRPPRDAAEPGERAVADDAQDADRAAYAIVYAALADDTGFELPAGFAEAMAAQAMPAPPRPSIVERWVLPVLLVLCSAIAIPATVPQLARAFRILLGGPEGGVPAAGLAALALLLVAAADQVARRRGWGPAARG